MCLLIQCCRCFFDHREFDKACRHCKARSTKVAELEAILVHNTVTARGDVSVAAAMMQSWPDDVRTQYLSRIKTITLNTLLSSETGVPCIASSLSTPIACFMVLHGAHGSDVFGNRYLTEPDI